MLLFLISLQSITQFNLTVKQLITLSFENEKTCLWYISKSNNNFDHHIASTLQKLQIPLQNIAYNNLLSCKNFLNCNGYLIVVNNLQELVAILKRGNDFTLRPHKRVVVFLNNYNKFDLLNNDVLLQNVYLHDLQMFIATITDGSYNLSVISVKDRTNMTRHSDYGLKKFKPQFAINGRNYSLVVATHNYPPIVYINATKLPYDGLEYIIFQEIAKDWPVKYDICQGDRCYVKIRESVEVRESDVAFGAIWDFTCVNMDLDMSLTYVENCHTFLVPKPHLLPDETFITHSLKLNFLIAMTLNTLAIGFLITTLNYVYNRTKQIDFFHGCLVALRLITGGYVEFPPSNQIKLRFVLLLWYISCVLFTTTYSAGLTSVLSKPLFTNIIRTKQDMIDNELLWLDVENIAELYSYSQLFVKRQLMQYGIVTKTIEKRDCLLRTGKYGIGLAITGKLLLSIIDLDDYAIEHLKFINECDLDCNYVFVLKKHSALTTVINEQIRRFKEHGLIDIWTQFIAKNLNLTRTDQLRHLYATKFDSFVPINFTKLLIAFLLLGFGYFIAAFVFFFEYATRFLIK